MKSTGTKLSANPFSPNRLFNVLDSILWWGLLIFIAAASFIFHGYGSVAWLTFSAAFYLWFALRMWLLFTNARFNGHALWSARWVIVLLFLSILWLWLQLNLEYSHALYELFDTSAASIDWLKLDPQWSVTPSRGRWLLMSELQFFALFVAVLISLDRRSRVKHLLVLFIVVGLVHSMIGLLGKYSGVLFVEARQVDGHFDVARGLFINRNHFGAFTVLTLLGVFAFQFRVLRKLRGHQPTIGALLKQYLLSAHVFLFAILAVSLFACLNSQSRGALLSLIAGLVMALCLSGDYRRLWNNRGLAISVSLLVVLTITYFGQEVTSRLAREALSLGERSQQWEITWRAIKLNSLFGYGGGSYGTVFQIFRDTTSLRDVFYSQSHNHYLHLWLERGLIGLGLWLTVLGLSLVYARKVLVNTGSSLVYGTVAACTVVIIAALVQSLVDFNLQILNIRAYFMVVLAILFAVPHIRHR